MEKMRAGHVREGKEMRCREEKKYNINSCSIFLTVRFAKEKLPQ
jgi:hypothetical protein